MRSARFRKLMQGLQQEQPEDPYEATLSPTVTAQCRIIPQLQKELQDLYNQQPVLDILPQFIESIDLPEEVLGKKSSEIAISKSNMFCLKNVSQEDLATLNKIFDPYAEHVKKQQDNRLIPIFGAVVLQSIHTNHTWNDYFIVMPNLQLEGKVLFDIKGHTDKRGLRPSDYEDFQFGKDQNFLKSKYRQLMKKAPSAFKSHFMRTVETNVSFLRKCQIIDYSLALVFGPKGQEGAEGLKWQQLDSDYVVSYYIIDYLQVYNQRKKLQNKVKSLFFKQISSVDPDTYAERLLEFLKRCIN